MELDGSTAREVIDGLPWALLRGAHDRGAVIGWPGPALTAVGGSR